MQKWFEHTCFVAKMIYTHFFLLQKLLMHLFLSQKEFTHVFLSRKRFTRFFLSRKWFTHSARKVFARWKLPSGKFRLFGPLPPPYLEIIPKKNRFFLVLPYGLGEKKRRFSYLVTQLTIPDKLKNSYHDIDDIDESDLVHSCTIFLLLLLLLGWRNIVQGGNPLYAGFFSTQGSGGHTWTKWVRFFAKNTWL